MTYLVHHFKLLKDYLFLFMSLLHIEPGIKYNRSISFQGEKLKTTTY